MSPRDTYMLGFTLFCVGVITPPLLMLGAWLFPAVFDLSAAGGFFLALAAVPFIASVIQWLARCNSCDLSLIWRYQADAPRLLRYQTMNWLPPKTCSRCGDSLE